MFYDQKILVGKSGDEDVYIYPKMANRHGMIAGATGTGKTITLKVLAESFSEAGVPVFLADVKGDLSAMCSPGKMTDDMQERISRFGLAEKGFTFTGFPSAFWDVYGEAGLPLRTTVSEMGPLLMASVLELNDTQADLLSVVYKIADDQGLLLLDTKDLKAMLNYVAENASEFSSDYGHISKASLNVIIRAIVELESEGADLFFGEPALSISDWFMTYAGETKGKIHILDCRKLINYPNMYSAFLLWLLSELFETLPENGDADKPRMVFFFDEAHLLFNSASKALLQKIEQVVKLIRSKGIGIYFITQSPKDIPDGVLAQLGNKIQHALHAYTPSEQKAVKTAAQSYRANPAFSTCEAIQELGIGEALVSVLDESGVPTVVERTKILPPQSQMGQLDDNERQSLIQADPLYKRYTDYFDRDSAYEFLNRIRNGENTSAAASVAAGTAVGTSSSARMTTSQRLAARNAAVGTVQTVQEEGYEPVTTTKSSSRTSSSKRTSQSAFNTVAKNVAKTTGSTVGRELGKNVGSSVGGKFGKTLGGNIGSTLGRSILGTFFK